MNIEKRQVSTAGELQAAVENPNVGEILVSAPLGNLPTPRLLPGQMLVGIGEECVLQFAAGSDGLALTADNRVERLRIVADAKMRAVYSDTSIERLGRLILHDLTVTGVIQLLARDRVQSGHVQAHNIDIVTADTRAYEERPKSYGVEVIPGAFTLWNQQSNPAVTITAELSCLSAGRAGAPVRGSGIFVAGAGNGGGRLSARRLETGPVYSDGGIAPGTPDRITGGVFVVSGAFVDKVHNYGPVATYGPNDMVLDNWGTVDRWIADEEITSHGPSGIGFVNFGTVDLLQVNAPIETFGQGARGFNIYAGTIKSAEFERIVTHADGAVGIQISQPIGRITVHRGIETYGGTGDSLVKGVVVKLPATALSIKPTGSARQINVAGGLLTHGAGINPLELHGAVDALQITEGFTAAGGGFEQI